MAGTKVKNPAHRARFFTQKLFPPEEIRNKAAQAIHPLLESIH
jgi:hypothetical protein